MTEFGPTQQQPGRPWVYGWPPPPPPPPPPRRRLGTFLGAAALVVLAVLALVVWAFTRPNGSGPTGLSRYRAPAGAVDSTGLADKVTPALVDVYTTLGYQGGQAAGTGIVLTSNGDVLTNNHVVEGATKIDVVDLGNGRTYSATVAGYNRSEDIAVLRLRGATGLTTASMGNADAVRVGDAVLGIGNAGGQGGAPDVAPGTVAALGQSITATDQDGGNAEQLTELIQVNANIQPGDSGGPLVNSAGEVIGVDTAASSRYHLGRGGGRQATGQGFAIPINKALDIARQIQSGKASPTVHIGASALLGVSVTATGTGGGSGALVGEVVSGGPAEQAGLSAGDLITELDGQPVDSPTALTHLMDQHHPGDTVPIHWLDQNQTQHTGTAHLTAGPVG